MKIYVHSSNGIQNGTDNNIETINIVLNFSVNDVPIAASSSSDSDSDNIDKYSPIVNLTTGVTIKEMYDRLINKILSIAEGMRLTLLHKEPSGGFNPSHNSMYMDFCIETMMGSKTVRLVLYLRVTDHHDWSKDKRIDKITKRAHFYETGQNLPGDNTSYNGNSGQIGISNPNHGKLEVILDNIKVGDESCNTIDEAAAEVRRIFKKFIELESMPFTSLSAEKFVEQLQLKLDKLEISHEWVIFSDTDTLKELPYFIVSFEQHVRGKSNPKSIFVTIEYIMSGSSKRVSVKMRVGGKSAKHLFDIKCTDAYITKNIFDEPQMKNLFKKYIKPEIEGLERLTIE